MNVVADLRRLGENERRGCSKVSVQRQHREDFCGFCVVQLRNRKSEHVVGLEARSKGVGVRKSLLEVSTCAKVSVECMPYRRETANPRTLNVQTNWTGSEAISKPAAWVSPLLIACHSAVNNQCRLQTASCCYDSARGMKTHHESWSKNLLTMDAALDAWCGTALEPRAASSEICEQSPEMEADGGGWVVLEDKKAVEDERGTWCMVL